jgi:hypothetical protein
MSKTKSAVGIDDLKSQYLSIEPDRMNIEATRAEMYWKQGHILRQIKAQLKHGEWLPWITENFALSATQAKLRMAVGRLPALPKSPENRRFNLDELSAIAAIAARHKMSPDVAAERFIAQEKVAADPAPAESGQDAAAGESGITRSEAFKILGINIERGTIRLESLQILAVGLQQARDPDMGGINAITEAVKTLSPRAKLRSGGMMARNQARGSAQEASA